MTPPPEHSLDRMAIRALSGDLEAETALFETLRVRFLDVAKRRVRDEDCEDLTQDALRIVHAKYGTRHEKSGILPWAFTILRNVIGNYYQKRERRGVDEKYRDDVFAGIATEPEAHFDTGERIVDAVMILSKKHARCGRIFRRIIESLADGGSPNEISSRAFQSTQSDEPSLTRGNYYTSLHRCRSRLREVVRTLEGDRAE